MGYKQEAIERFQTDVFATKTTGIQIEAADVNYAKCSLAVNEAHFNAAGLVMGGAIFTLADFAFAVAANTGNPLTLSLSSQINFLKASKGPVLYAEANCVKNGKTICFFEIEVKDGMGLLIAQLSITGFRKE